MATPFRFRLITPEGVFYDGDVEYLGVRGRDGDMGILAGHLPIVTPLKVAPVEVQAGADRLKFAVHGGFLEVGPEGAVVLAQIAEAAGDISVERARSALSRARQRLSGTDASVDQERAVSAEARALARLAATGALQADGETAQVRP